MSGYGAVYALAAIYGLGTTLIVLALVDALRKGRDE